MSLKLSEIQSNKMLSEAGKSYDKTRVPNPYSTRQRFRYYHRDPVQSTRRLPKHYQTLDSNLRSQRNSFVLRHTLQTVVNTDHNPNFKAICQREPRQIFAKGKCERYIGEVKQLDFSQPLREDCDHRCARSNNVAIEPEQSFLSEEQLNLPLASFKGKELPVIRTDRGSREKLRASQLRSTEHSLVKKRSKLTMEVKKRDEEVRKERKRGVNFSSSLGHQYLKQVSQRDPSPEFYDIESCRQSYVKRSMKEPRVFINFSQFRDSIATRHDRSDPSWHIYMDNSSNSHKEKAQGYDFNMNSPRQLNEVLSKYPFRQNMNFYIFPPKAAHDQLTSAAQAASSGALLKQGSSD